MDFVDFVGRSAMSDLEAAGTLENFRKRVFESAVKRANLKPLGFHDLRHTFVAFLIDSGMGKNPLFVQRTLGHSKIDTTFGVYGHLFPAAEDEARQQLDQFIGSRSFPDTRPEESDHAR